MIDFRDIYNSIITIIKTIIEETSEFLIIIGLYQGSILSTYLFILVRDELTKYIEDGIHGVCYLQTI